MTIIYPNLKPAGVEEAEEHGKLRKMLGRGD